MQPESSHRRAPRRLAIAVIVALFCVASAPAALAQLSDVKGSKDHPMVSRYAGSVIIGYDARKFDEFDIPLGPLTRLDTRGNHLRAFQDAARGRKRHADSLRRSGGSITARDRAELRARADEERIRRSLHVRRDTVRPTGRLARDLLSLYPQETAVSDATAGHWPAGRAGVRICPRHAGQSEIPGDEAREAGRRCLRLGVCRHEQIHSSTRRRKTTR